MISGSKDSRKKYEESRARYEADYAQGLSRFSRWKQKQIDHFRKLKEKQPAAAEVVDKMIAELEAQTYEPVMSYPQFQPRKLPTDILYVVQSSDGAASFYRIEDLISGLIDREMYKSEEILFDRLTGEQRPLYLAQDAPGFSSVGEVDPLKKNAITTLLVCDFQG